MTGIETNKNHFDVLIVGGGIAGLSVAYYLQQLAAASRIMQLKYAIIERDTKLGGKIQSESSEVEGRTVILEDGPDSIVNTPGACSDLIKELGLDQKIVAVNPRNLGVGVLRGGRVHPMAPGLFSLKLKSLLSLFDSQLLSSRAKLRLLLEPFLSPYEPGVELSIAEFFSRRFGQEFLDYVIEPLVCGIYSGSADKLSMSALLPNFRSAEYKLGALTRYSLATAIRALRDSRTTQMVTFNGGMYELVRALSRRMTGDLITETSVLKLESSNKVRLEPKGAIPNLELETVSATGTRRLLTAQHVIIAIPSYEAASILDNSYPSLAATLRSIRYADVGILSSISACSSKIADTPYTGVIFPAVESPQFNSLTFVGQKIPATQLANHQQIRAHFGGARTAESIALSDSELITQLRSYIDRYLTPLPPSKLSRIKRWSKAIPQYEIGHQQVIQAAFSKLPANISLVGAAYRGMSIPACIYQGREAALNVTKRLSVSYFNKQSADILNQCQNDKAA